MGGIPRLFFHTSAGRIKFRQRIVSGQLAGQALRKELDPLVMMPEIGDRPDIIAAHHFLLFCAARCPSAEVRADALVKAEIFAENLREHQPIRFDALDEVDQELLLETALPATPKSRVISFEESRPFSDAFPDSKIDWHGTYHHLSTDGCFSGFGGVFYRPTLEKLAYAGLLEHPIEYYSSAERFAEIGKKLKKITPGTWAADHADHYVLYVFLKQLIESGDRGPLADRAPAVVPKIFKISYGVPSYRALMVDDVMRTDSQAAWNLMRRSLFLRKREILAANHRGTIINMFVVPLSREYALYGSGAEEVFGFYFPNQSFFTGLLVRNSWPQGYAMAWECPQLEETLGFNFHIFKEYRDRGSDNAEVMVRAFMRAAERRTGIGRFALERNVSAKEDVLLGFAQEETAVLDAFLRGRLNAKIVKQGGRTFAVVEA